MAKAPTTILRIHLDPLPGGFARGRESLHQLAFFAIAPWRVSAWTTGVIADSAGWVVVGVLIVTTFTWVRARTRRQGIES